MPGSATRATKEYLEPAETKQLEDAATCLRDQLLFRLLRVLGCRVSEVLFLKEEDFDFQARRVTIAHLKASITLACPHCGVRLARKYKFCSSCGEKVGKALKKKMEYRRQRQLPVDVGTLRMVRDYLDQGGGVAREDGRYLLPITRQRAWQIFREYADRLGLPEIINRATGKVHHVGPHKMRDAFAVNAMKIDSTGDGQRLLQEHLGHASFDTTARYRKIAGVERERWFEKVTSGNEKQPAGGRCQKVAERLLR